MPKFNCLNRFLHNTDGTATVLNVFWLVTCLGLAGLAIDMGQAMNLKNRMQVTADAAAHAAAVFRFFH